MLLDQTETRKSQSITRRQVPNESSALVAKNPPANAKSTRNEGNRRNSCLPYHNKLHHSFQTEVMSLTTRSSGSLRRMADKRDDPSLHQGRKRGFAHVVGNFATHVYLPGPGFCGLLTAFPTSVAQYQRQQLLFFPCCNWCWATSQRQCRASNGMQLSPLLVRTVAQPSLTLHQSLAPLPPPLIWCPPQGLTAPAASTCPYREQWH